jgi:hypothetical protein
MNVDDDNAGDDYYVFVRSIRRVRVWSRRLCNTSVNRAVASGGDPKQVVQHCVRSSAHGSRGGIMNLKPVLTMCGAALVAREQHAWPQEPERQEALWPQAPHQG